MQVLGKMSLGIGITTFNRNRLVKKTIAQIEKHTNLPFKLVVVDDGSRVPVEEATYRFHVNHGAPISKNKCLELLEDCEHIFLFDDDTFPLKEGWQDLYINSPYKHLNYTFKYGFQSIDGHRHLENPNGCMIYLHNDVLKKVGGFDTGFIKYGYWHGAYSNRVFNSGLIPHPFIDVPESKDYLYCLDQKRGTNRTATPNRGIYLRQNKQRYQDKINSSEYIDYVQKKEVDVWYSNPFSTSKNIGKALNRFCEVVPDDAWICLQDGDIAYLTPDWGKQIEEVIQNYGDQFGIFGCMTNRIARPVQRSPEMFDNHNMLDNRDKAIELSKDHWGEVQDITKKKYVAGFFMLFPKSVWSQVKFPENNIAFDDAFSLGVVKKGHKLGLMKGLYVYHLYRAWSDNPTRERSHLK